MKLSSISAVAPSFCARVVRQQTLGYNVNTGRQEINYLTKSDIARSYDRQIALLERQKEAAMDLDEFMHSDEVTELVNQLPADDEVEICNSFYNDAEAGDSIRIDNHHILFDHYNDGSSSNWDELTRQEQHTLSYIDVQNPDGSINKSRIIEALETLIQQFKK